MLNQHKSLAILTKPHYIQIKGTEIAEVNQLKNERFLYSMQVEYLNDKSFSKSTFSILYAIQYIMISHF